MMLIGFVGLGFAGYRARIRRGHGAARLMRISADRTVWLRSNALAVAWWSISRRLLRRDEAPARRSCAQRS
jgi:hypothetical protein